jgi:hypothetical protein
MRDDAPAAVEGSRPARVVALLSAPRLGFTDPLCLMAQLPAMGIELRKDSGAYFEQSMTRLLQRAVDDDFDYALTLDYDSVFRPGDVAYLLRLITMAPADVAAVFPVQYRREGNELIGRLLDADPSRGMPHLAPAQFGHFGLTFIRLSALRDLPHPWLWSQPGANGRWDAPDKVDADIGFWNKLRGAGHRVCLAPRCVIGHLQQMITWPGEDFEATHQYAGQYFRDGDAPRDVLEAAAQRAAKRES